MCDPCDSQGDEKNVISISIAFFIEFFYQKWKYNFRGMQNKNPFEMKSTPPTLKAFNIAHMIISFMLRISLIASPTN